MDLLKTLLLYMSMLYVSAVQVAPDPATANITPSPAPSPTGIYASATVDATAATPAPTPAITANPAYGTLVLGDRGEVVGKVQQKLLDLGYDVGDIDSAYGNQTSLAVKAFQKRNGLTVDGIAGKYTQTILFEYDSVKPAITATPAFIPDATLTPPPATPAPAVAETEPPTPVPATAEPTATPTATPDPNAPVLLTEYSFVFDGFTQTLTVGDTDTVLHPVEQEEALYIPLTEILQNAGNVIITNNTDTGEELAFNVFTDFYQVSYTVSDDGSLSDLVFEKNAQPQPLQNRSALLLDGVFYLPMEDMVRITGINVTVDDTAGSIIITMPASGT